MHSESNLGITCIVYFSYYSEVLPRFYSLPLAAFHLLVLNSQRHMHAEMHIHYQMQMSTLEDPVTAWAMCLCPHYMSHFQSSCMYC